MQPALQTENPSGEVPRDVDRYLAARQGSTSAVHD
jgi:hypothetical protein